jgi:hypothetical protein
VITSSNEVSPLEVSSQSNAQLEDKMNSMNERMCKLEELITDRFGKLEK